VPRKRKGPPPAYARRYRGGPRAGKIDFGLSGAPITSEEVYGEDNKTVLGVYRIAEKAGPIPSENSVAWWYDWVPSEAATADAGEHEDKPSAQGPESP
jgi:hypothetical protein